MALKFYKCATCGKVVEIIDETAVPTMCCGQAMAEIVPGTVDAAVEKHIPTFEIVGNIVNVVVGEVEHPMLDVHYIEWIAIETKQGSQRKSLKPNDAPKASFALAEGDELVAVYAYCNLHGLWKKEA